MKACDTYDAMKVVALRYPQLPQTCRRILTKSSLGYWREVEGITVPVRWCMDNFTDCRTARADDAHFALDQGAGAGKNRTD